MLRGHPRDTGRGAVTREWHHLRETWDSDALEPISNFIEAAIGGVTGKALALWLVGGAAYVAIELVDLVTD